MKNFLQKIMFTLLVISALWLVLGIIVVIQMEIDFATLFVAFLMFILPFATFLFLYLQIKKSNKKVSNDLNQIAPPTSAHSLPAKDNSLTFENAAIIPKSKESAIISSVPEKEYDFSCIDFETANEEMCSACSIGLIAVKDLKIVKEEYFLIKPPSSYFNQANIDVHGITYEQVKSALAFDQVWEKIKDYFTSSTYLVAHNARFDMSVLNQTAHTYNLEIPDFQYIDSISFTSKVRESGNKLTDCAEYFGVDIGTHHDALDDARTCANIMICAIKKSRFKTVYSYLKGYPSIPIKIYSELKPQKTFAKTKSSNVRISDITTSQENFDMSHPFYQKNIVLTGELNTLSRSVAMQKIVDVGGIVKSSVSSKTHFLVVGNQNLSLVNETGISSKEQKAHELNENGLNIKIINEETFLLLLKNQ